MTKIEWDHIHFMRGNLRDERRMNVEVSARDEELRTESWYENQKTDTEEREEDETRSVREVEG